MSLHTALVKKGQVLSRFSNITLEEGASRFTIWGMAFEGLKERPRKCKNL